MNFLKISFVVFFIIKATTSYATIKVNSLFSNHMVLQQGVEVPIWGSSSQEEKVTINFNGQTVTTKPINGKWFLKLSPLKTGGPFQMTIVGSEKIIIEDILVGEVWLCSGQSNMERQLKPRKGQKDLFNWEQERDLAYYPQIRQYMVPLKFSETPIEDTYSKWTVCNSKNVLDFSAIGYFFARDLYKNIKTPIGILFSSYGGTEAEYWTSKKDLEESKEFSKVIESYNAAITKYQDELKQFQDNQDVNSVKASNQNSVNNKDAASNKAVAPVIPFRGRMPAGLYNAMIYPLLSYQIKGVCWYQGESNVLRSSEYANLLSLMISGWRRDFNQGLFPFLIVQIAPYKTMVPEIREAQWDVTKKALNTALIVTTDCGDSSDIHPAFKQPVGQRLATASLGLGYHKKVETSGPEYINMTTINNKVVLSFDHVGKGLVAKDGDLRGFEIAGVDMKFEPANADIKGKKIVVYSTKVQQPLFVRYAWSNVPNVNLYNKNGLPAIPFRTHRN